MKPEEKRQCLYRIDTQNDILQFLDDAVQETFDTTPW